MSLHLGPFGARRVIERRKPAVALLRIADGLQAGGDTGEHREVMIEGFPRAWCRQPAQTGDQAGVASAQDDRLSVVKSFGPTVFMNSGPST